MPEPDISSPSYAHIDALVQEARTSAAGRLIVERKVKGRPDQTFLATHPLVSETLYRMVEESLSNIRKYSGLLDGRHVRTLIEETWLPGTGGTGDGSSDTYNSSANGTNGSSNCNGNSDSNDGTNGDNGTTGNTGSVRIIIRDDGQGAAAAGDGHSAGYGLLGMRERVEACGGTLATGPIPAEEGGGFWVRAAIPVTAMDRIAADRTVTGIAVATDPDIIDPAIAATWIPDATTGRTIGDPQTGIRQTGITDFTVTRQIHQNTTPPAFGMATGAPGTSGPAAASTSGRWHPSSSSRWRPSGWWRRQRTRVRGIGSPAGYSVADIIISVCICLTAAMVFLPNLLHRGGDLDWAYCLVSYTGALGCAIPLAFLHPYPEKPAIVTASAMGATIAATIVLNRPLPFLSLVCGLVALYALIAYGPERARRWATPACVVLVLLACVGEVCLTVCHDGQCIEKPDSSDLFNMTALFIGSAIIFGATVLIVALLARLHRERGMDPVLLASHRQALLRQREQAGRLAARRERERVSAQIHEEVAQTLRQVSDSAGQACAELERIDARSQASGKVSDEDSATIVRLFSQTAQTGRKVLAHIRELIGVLRSNETEEESRKVLLAPVSGTEQAGARPTETAQTGERTGVAPTDAERVSPVKIGDGATRERP